MGLSTRVWTAGKLLMLAGGLVATFLVCFAVSMRIALRMREVAVPDLSSRSAAEAAAMSTAVGLTVKVDDARRAGTAMEEGLVVAQDPPAGAIARRQRSVRVWLSAGNRATTVPPLAGETERTARLRLAQSGLQAATAEIRSPAFDADVVIAHDPPARGAGPRVVMLVNRRTADESYVMPDLVGTVGERAADVLRQQGMRVAIVAAQPYSGAVPGTVLRQSPAGGFKVGLGDAISLEVSR